MIVVDIYCIAAPLARVCRRLQSSRNSHFAAIAPASRAVHSDRDLNVTASLTFPPNNQGVRFIRPPLSYLFVAPGVARLFYCFAASFWGL